MEEDWWMLLDKLEKEHKNNTGNFFKITKNITKVQKKVKLVSALLDEEGNRMDLDIGISQIIKKLYCPIQSNVSNVITETIAS